MSVRYISVLFNEQKTKPIITTYSDVKKFVKSGEISMYVESNEPIIMDDFNTYEVTPSSGQIISITAQSHRVNTILRKSTRHV